MAFNPLAILSNPVYNLFEYIFTLLRWFDSLVFGSFIVGSSAEPTKFIMSSTLPKLIRAEVLALSSTSSDPSTPHLLARDDASNSSSTNGTSSSAHDRLGIHLKRSDQHDRTVVIYHIHPDSYAATHTDLKVGCEVLAINDCKIRGGNVKSAVNLLDHFVEKDGKVGAPSCSLERFEIWADIVQHVTSSIFDLYFRSTFWHPAGIEHVGRHTSLRHSS